MGQPLVFKLLDFHGIRRENGWENGGKRAVKRDETAAP
jgi:hypothetical protein